MNKKNRGQSHSRQIYRRHRVELRLSDLLDLTNTNGRRGSRILTPGYSDSLHSQQQCTRSSKLRHANGHTILCRENSQPQSRFLCAFVYRTWNLAHCAGWFLLSVFCGNRFMPSHLFDMHISILAWYGLRVGRSMVGVWHKDLSVISDREVFKNNLSAFLYTKMCDR